MRRLLGGIIGGTFLALCGGLIAEPFRVSVRWLENAPNGEVVVSRGALHSLTVGGGEDLGEGAFQFSGKGSGQLDLIIDGEMANGLPTL